MKIIRTTLSTLIAALMVLLAACSQEPAPQEDTSLTPQAVITVSDKASCEAARGYYEIPSTECQFNDHFSVYSVQSSDTLELLVTKDLYLVTFHSLKNYGTIKFNVLSEVDYTFENNGNLELTKILKLSGNTQKNTRRGTITINDRGRLQLPSGANLMNEGTILVKSGGRFENTGSLINNGTITLACGSTFTNNGTYTGNPPQSPADCTPPSVTINQSAGQADPTPASSVSFTATFSEDVTGLEAKDISLSGTAGATTATVSGGPKSYTITVSGLTNSGTVIASLAANVATDAAGNGNTASTSTDNSVTYTIPVLDTTPPSVTINRHTNQPLFAYSNPVRFTVQFSEPVSDFTAADVVLRADFLANISGATVSVAGGPTVYDVSVSGLKGFGGLYATVAAAAAKDTSGNASTASTSTFNHVVINLP